MIKWVCPLEDSTIYFGTDGGGAYMFKFDAENGNFGDLKKIEGVEEKTLCCIKI